MMGPAIVGMELDAEARPQPWILRTLDLDAPQAQAEFKAMVEAALGASEVVPVRIVVAAIPTVRPHSALTSVLPEVTW